MNFKTALYLDDMRTPTIVGMDIVRSYDDFVNYFRVLGKTPDLISFDHDLSIEHYPLGVQTGGEKIDYSRMEKTGYHCAQFLVENNIPVRYWNVHSWNVVGKRNIEALLREHYPAGEVKLDIPFFCK